MKIDIHTHFIPPDLPDYRAKFGYGKFIRLEHAADGCSAKMISEESKFMRVIQKNCFNAVHRLEECDEHEVLVQVLSTIPVMFCYWANAKDALEVARFINESIASCVQAHPGRFIGLGTVPLQDPDMAIKELERCVKELGMPGVEIGSHVNEWNLDQEELFPFFEAAQELNAAIFVHPWNMMGRDRMKKYWMPWLVGMPAETTLAICSMIFGGVFERLPKLRVAFAHGGGAFPATFGRIQHGFDVRPDLCAVDNSVAPREYLGKFFVDSLVHDKRMLQYLIDTLGEDSIALGTDYPFPLGEHCPGKLIESMDELSDATKRKLLCDNALRWLDMKELPQVLGASIAEEKATRA